MLTGSPATGLQQGDNIARPNWTKRNSFDHMRGNDDGRVVMVFGLFLFLCQ